MFPLPELLTTSLQPCVDFLNTNMRLLGQDVPFRLMGAWGHSRLVQKQVYLHAGLRVTMALQVLRVKSTNGDPLPYWIPTEAQFSRLSSLISECLPTLNQL